MITHTPVRASWYTLFLSILIGSSWEISASTGTEDTADICALCTDELYKTDTPLIFFDCEQKVLHGYHLNCTEDLFSKRYHKCPLCDKPAKFLNPLVKNGDYSKIHGLKRDLTRQEQDYLKAFLQKWSSYQSHKPFPKQLLLQHTHQQEAPKDSSAVPTQTVPSVSAKNDTKSTYDDLSTDFIAQLTEQQRKELFDMPIAHEQFPPIPLSAEDVKLNSELPKDLDPKEWQVIITNEGKRLRARRTTKLIQWPPAELEQSTTTFNPSKELKNLEKKLEGTVGDLALGFCAGLLTGKEFEATKEWSLDQLQKKEADTKNLSQRRLLYAPTLLGGYYLSNRINPQRKMTTKTAINLAVGYLLGVGLHLFLHPQEA